MNTATDFNSTYGKDRQASDVDTDMPEFWSRKMSTAPQESSSDIWKALRVATGGNSRRTLANALFMASSLPMGLAAFVGGVVGGSLGISLAIFGVGLAILIWTIGLLLRFSHYERERLNALLGTELTSPRYTVDEGANVVVHLGHVARSSRVRRDVVYMLSLFPIGVAEFAIVFFPLQCLLATLGYVTVGDLSPFYVLGMHVNTWWEAIISLGLGVIALPVVAVLVNIVAPLHKRYAQAMLGSK